MIAPKLVDGDLVVENGELVMIDGDEELAQSIRSILETRKGEFFLEPEHGLSFENLFGKTAYPDELRDDIIEAVSQEPRVESITNVQIFDNRETRKRSVNLTIQKENGEEVEIGEVNLGGVG
jgi:phage baseplate assembly protein W